MRHHIISFRSLLLMGISLLSAACKKEKKVDNQYPVVFESVQIVKKSNIQMCTPEGIKAVPPEYKTIAESAQVFSIGSLIELGEPYLSLQSDQTALFYGDYAGNYNITKNGDEWRFTSDDYGWITNLDTDILVSKLQKYREPLSNAPIVGSEHFQAKQILIANGDLTEIRLPILSYYFIRMDGNGFRSATWYFLNEFDDAVLAELRNDDLLFIQKYELVCRAVSRSL